MYYMSHNKIGYSSSFTTNHRRLQQLNTSARRMLWIQQSQEPPKEEYEKRSLLCQRLDEWNRSNG